MHSKSRPNCPGLKKSRCLEGVAGADVLQFLGDLGRRSVQLFGHAFLLVGVHAVELLAQIAVDHILGNKRGGKNQANRRLENFKRNAGRKEATGKPTLTGK